MQNKLNFLKHTTYIPAESLELNIDVSVKVLHRTKDTTLGQCAFISVNFCARKPPVRYKIDV